MQIRTVDEDIRLIPYYRNDEASLPWYQDPELCRQVDGTDRVYDAERLHRMYDFLCSRGECWYIEYRGVLVGDVSLRDDGETAIAICREYQNRHIGRKCVSEILKIAEEKGMAAVTATVYAFNEQSRRMFLSAGFERTGEEQYVYRTGNARPRETDSTTRG